MIRKSEKEDPKIDIGPIIPQFLLDNPGTQKNARVMKVCGMSVLTFINFPLYSKRLGLKDVRVRFRNDFTMDFTQ